MAHENAASVRLEDIARIAFVTRRFLELQGLIPAALGAGWLLGSLMHHAISGPGRAFGFTQALLFGIMLTGPATQELQKLYRRTFGDVVASVGQKLSGGMLIWVFSAGVFADMALNMNGSRSGPSVAAIALASYSLMIALRDWRWRSHYLVAAGSGIVAAIVTASVPASPGQWGIDPVRSEAYLLAFSLMGLGLVASGLFDHQLLASSLRRPAAPPRSRESWGRRGRRRGRTRAWIAAGFAVSAGLTLRCEDAVLVLAVPGALMMTFVALYILQALLQIRRGIRDFGTRVLQPDDGPTVDFSLETLVLMIVIALAAAVDSALYSRTSPALLTVTLGLSSVWLAVREWRGRKHYLLGAIGALVVLWFIPQLHPARAFALLVFVTATVVTMTSLFDSWITSASEALNVDPL